MTFHRKDLDITGLGGLEEQLLGTALTRPAHGPGLAPSTLAAHAHTEFGSLPTLPKGRTAYERMLMFTGSLCRRRNSPNICHSNECTLEKTTWDIEIVDRCGFCHYN